MPLAFSFNDIRDALTQSALDKARTYQRSGRAKIQEIENGGCQISGLVKGSERRPYRVDIAIEPAVSAGTPIENHLGELWALFDFVSPGFLGDAKKFARVWRGPIEKKGDQERQKRLARTRQAT